MSHNWFLNRFWIRNSFVTQSITKFNTKLAVKFGGTLEKSKFEGKMKYPKITFFVFILWICGIYLIFKIGEKESEINDKLLKNNVEIIGIIESIQISNNHCFAIIHLKNIKTNTKIFNQKLNKKYFPYAIRNGKSEIYAHICNFENIGDTLTLKSNEKIIMISQNSNIKKSIRDIGIVREETDMNFIKLNTKLYK